jgi:hypothetical protein
VKRLHALIAYVHVSEHVQVLLMIHGTGLFDILRYYGPFFPQFFLSALDTIFSDISRAGQQRKRRKMKGTG